MATQQHQAATPSPSYEITVHWSEREPAIVSRLDRGQAYELVERLARTAPDQLGEPGVDEAPEPTRLLMGLQAFYRLTVQAGSCLNLADTAGGLWAIPAGSVRGVRVRLLAPASAAPIANGDRPTPDVIPFHRATGGAQTLMER